MSSAHDEIINTVNDLSALYHIYVFFCLPWEMCFARTYITFSTYCFLPSKAEELIIGLHGGKSFHKTIDNTIIQLVLAFNY